jgi:hypothetical protein
MTILTGVYYYLGITFVTKKRLMSDRLMWLHDKGEQRICQAVNCLFFRPDERRAGHGRNRVGEAMNYTNPNRSQFLI